MKKIVLLVVLCGLLAVSLVACGDDDEDFSNSEVESPNYTIVMLVEDQIIIVKVIDPDGDSLQELAAGIEEVSETYSILEVTAIARYYWRSSTTSAVILLVEPLQ